MSPSRLQLWLVAPALLMIVLVAGFLATRDRQGGLPGSPESVLEHAIFLGRTGQQEEAALLLRRAIDVHPDRPELHFRLGYVLRYTGLLDESIASYRRGLELDDSPTTRVSAEGQIAKSLVYLGDYAGALALQQGLHEYVTDLGGAVDEKMLFYEGVMHFYAGDPDRATALFDAARVADPGSLWTAFGLAYGHAVNGDTVRLSSLARELVVRDVADGERHYRLVHFHALAGEQKEAVARLRAAHAAGFFSYPYIRDDPLMASLRQVPGFHETLAEIRTRHEAFRARW